MSESTSDWPWVLVAGTFWQLVLERAANTPDDVLIADEHGEQVTCAGFRDRVERVAAALHARGIGPGTRVAWQLPTRIGTLLVLGALRRLGAVQAPIIPLYRDREVAAALRACDAEFLVVPESFGDVDHRAMAERIASAGGPAPEVIVLGDAAPEIAVGRLPEPGIDPDAVRWIYFTSGSAGVPKGARHTDGTLLGAAAAFTGVGRIGRDGGDVLGMAFPVAHIGGVSFLITALCSGSSMLVLEAFVPAQAVALFRRHRVTVSGGAPPFYSAFVALARASPDEPLLPDLRLLKGGGAPCPPELATAVRAELGAVLAHDYGMTENLFVAIGCPDDPADVLAATDGRVSPTVEVRLRADGLDVAAGRVGEVQVRGSSLFRGYTSRDETVRAFTDDGWFRTGDLATLHPSGHLEVVGRLKELIIRKGENIAPQEIEQLLARHPDILEVAVVGLPDAQRGERVCAVVVPRPGVDVALAGVCAWLLDAGLMRQKLPEQLELVAELPRTGLAKVAKQQLRDRFAR